MFSKVREWRSGCVQLGVEREHEARMGQETEAKKRSAVCRNMNLPFTFPFTVPRSSFDFLLFCILLMLETAGCQRLYDE